jgi:hypothetical protein
MQVNKKQQAITYTGYPTTQAHSMVVTTLEKPKIWILRTGITAMTRTFPS